MTDQPEQRHPAEQSLETGGTAGALAPNVSADVTSTSKQGVDPGLQEVIDMYIQAYETRTFSPIVDNACESYQQQFGGKDTSVLEAKLAPYEIRAMVVSPPQVSGSTAIAKIELKLSKDGRTQTQRIQIRIVDEGGEWKFCGEDAA